MGVWQGVAMDSLRTQFTWVRHALSYALRPYGRFRGDPPKGGRPAAVFFPLGHPTPYAYGKK
jgi:hypothetical protein